MFSRLQLVFFCELGSGDLFSTTTCKVSNQATSHMTASMKVCVAQEGGEREASHAGLLQVLQHAAHSVERESVAKVWLLGLQTLKQLGMPIRGLLPQMELFLAGGVKLHLDVSRCPSSSCHPPSCTSRCSRAAKLFRMLSLVSLFDLLLMQLRPRWGRQRARLSA